MWATRVEKKSSSMNGYGRMELSLTSLRHSTISSTFTIDVGEGWHLEATYQVLWFYVV